MKREILRKIKRTGAVLSKRDPLVQNERVGTYAYGMDLVETVGTGVAWDNYDWFIETSSSKDTLHDTVRITYQVQTEDVLDFNSKENPDRAETIAVITKTKKRKRRAFESAELNIQSYRKKT